jgi:cell division protein FtsB
MTDKDEAAEQMDNGRNTGGKLYRSIAKSAEAEVLALRSEVEQQRKQWEDVRQRNVDLLAEIQRLQDALDTCRELRKFDTAEIKRLRELLMKRREEHRE